MSSQFYSEWRAISVKNWERQNPPLLRLKRRRGYGSSLFDAQFFRIDFDTLGERTKMIAAIAAALDPHYVATR